MPTDRRWETAQARAPREQQPRPASPRPAVEPAADASSGRRWRRFGEYRKTKRLELLNAAESEQPLPLLEKRRRSALSKREEAALVGFRRHERVSRSGSFIRHRRMSTISMASVNNVFHRLAL